MNRILDFSNNSKEIISLDELRESVDEVSTTGKPFNGIRHVDLWDRLGDIAARHNVAIDVKDIYATDSKNKIQPGVACFPHLEAVHGKNSLQASLLRRVVGPIHFPAYSDHNSTGGICVNFHQRGIELAYGNNIHVCTNLNIYGQTHIMSYGSKGMPLDKMFEVYENWIQKLPEFRENDLRMEEDMKSTFVDPRTAFSTLVGKLSIMAVKRAYIDSTLDSPLNISQTSEFTKRLLKKHGDKLDEQASIWDLFNLTTEILKPGEMNSEELLKQGTAAGNFFVNEYLDTQLTY